MADWAYVAPHPSSWVLMSPNESSQLEAAFGDQTRTECELQDSGGLWWRVDLERMEQHCAPLGITRAISRRQFPSADAYSWVWQDHAGWKRYDPCMEGQLGAAQAVGRRMTTIFVLSSDVATPYRIDWTSCAGAVWGTQCNVATGATRCIRCPALTFLRFQAQQLDTVQLAHLTGWSVLGPGEWEGGACDPIMFSPLGEDGEAVVRLPCQTAAISCTFNLATIERALRLSPHCPMCTQAYALPGVQPSGTMRTSTSSLSCEGHADCDTLILRYTFPSGTQGPRDPLPGAPYTGTRRTCYYPDSPLGWSCVRLLRLAFERGQLFRIGTSATTGDDNVVVWGGIHQKTTRFGGPPAHGWPDDTHLQRLQSEAACKGIVLPA